MKLFDDLMEASVKMADQASKKANEIADLGKKKMSKASVENELAKAQRQLGTLVYMMHKTNEHNEELLQQYIDEVAAVEKQLEELMEDLEKEEVKEDVEVKKICSVCATTLRADEKFCHNCGEKQL